MIENHAVFADTVKGEFFSDCEVAVEPTVRGGIAKVLDDGPYDAVLVDFELDDGSGTDAVFALREREYSGLIVATSAEDEGNTELVLAGADVACKKTDFGCLRSLLDSGLMRVSIDEPAIARAARSLEGLSVGDGFGERFFGPEDWAREQVSERAWPRSPWRYTDDTEMAIAIVEVLAERGHIEGSALARAFVRRFVADPDRGYGAGAYRLMQQVRRGVPWQEAARSLFGGQGSMGNGAAMRVTPVGAFFAEDLLSVVREARASAEVTHAHPDGQAGAIAVAVAAAYACRKRHCHAGATAMDLLPYATRLCPPGATRRGLERASRLPATTTPTTAAAMVGSGDDGRSSDTVPFARWCAARHLDDYQEALWATVEGLGDRDTTCAIVGGIVASISPPPSPWVQAREPIRFEREGVLDPKQSRLRSRVEAWLWAVRAGRWRAG